MYTTEKLKKIRKEKGYTIYDMAKLLNITPPFYSGLENNKKRLYYDKALEIASIFNMKPDEIFLKEK